MPTYQWPPAWHYESFLSCRDLTHQSGRWEVVIQPIGNGLTRFDEGPELLSGTNSFLLHRAPQNAGNYVARFLQLHVS